MDKIFISGASGYIGTNLIENLVSKSNCKIYGLARDLDKIAEIDGVDKENFFPLDINNYEGIKKKLDEIKPNIIVHLAAIGFNPQKNPSLEELLKINYEATYKLAEFAQEKKVERFIYLTTYMECEGGKLPITSDKIIKPQLAYALSKSLATNHLLYLAKKTNLDITILRIFSVYGKKDLPFRFIPQLLEAFKENRTLETTKLKQKRDFIYISDVVDAICASLKRKKNVKVDTPIYNIGFGKAVRLYDIYKKIKKQFPQSKAQIKIGAKDSNSSDDLDYFADIAKAKKYLNWKPKISLDEGIKLTAREYK